MSVFFIYTSNEVKSAEKDFRRIRTCVVNPSDGVKNADKLCGLITVDGVTLTKAEEVAKFMRDFGPSVFKQDVDGIEETEEKK